MPMSPLPSAGTHSGFYGRPPARHPGFYLGPPRAKAARPTGAPFKRCAMTYPSFEAIRLERGALKIRAPQRAGLHVRALAPSHRLTTPHVAPAADHLPSRSPARTRNCCRRLPNLHWFRNIELSPRAKFATLRRATLAPMRPFPSSVNSRPNALLR